jgi:hypothetical protein
LPTVLATIYSILIFVTADCVENEVDSVTENNDKNIQKEEKINWL